jgi:hypothetical protein
MKRLSALLAQRATSAPTSAAAAGKATPARQCSPSSHAQVNAPRAMAERSEPASRASSASSAAGGGGPPGASRQRRAAVMKQKSS